MSASKGRDWMEYPSFVAAALEHKRGNLALQDLLDMAESIVRRELAEKVDEWQMSFDVRPSHPSGEWYSTNEFEEAVDSMVSHVLSLLTDTPENDNAE